MHQYFRFAAGFLLLYAQACVPLKNLERNNLLNPGNHSNTFLNGTYANRAPRNNGNGFYSLWFELDYRRNNEDTVPAKAMVQLELLSPRQLKASLWNNDTLLKTITLKGKIKDGYFSVRRYYNIIPIPFIYFRHNDHKIRLGKTTDGRLVADAAESHGGWILVMAAGYRQQYSMQFYAAEK
ncbi:MAG: hypothetical protein JNM68_01490 [Dinghuibacter sp.]|nr:hypothetical protein [Dinghuibacter sp.]